MKQENQRQLQIEKKTSKQEQENKTVRSNTKREEETREEAI